MSAQPAGAITDLLSRIAAGDESAKNQLIDVAYDELRRVAAGLMRGERAEHTLQPTALVHEAALRLTNEQALDDLPSRRYFFWAMARAMRQVLVDHARSRGRIRRGGGRPRVALDDVLDSLETEQHVDLLALDEALSELREINEREYNIVTLRFFGGLPMTEVAKVLEVSRSTAQADWQFARAWLRRRLSESN